jgi:hypothetical protein
MRVFYALVVICLFFSGCAGTNQAPKKTISSKVYGHVMSGEEVFVPKANISITCGIHGRTHTIADDHGYYLADVDCPQGSIVEANAWSVPQEICIMPGTCMPFKGGQTSGSGNISSAGYAKIDMVIKQ